MNHLTLTLALALTLTTVQAMPAAEVNLTTWDETYSKVATGARDGVQYNLYRKAGDTDGVYLELLNRGEQDVKVDLRLVSGHHRGEPGANLTGFVKAKGFWPNGVERRLATTVPDPEIELRQVSPGQVEEEQVIEIAADGTQTTRMKYRFTTLDDKKREAKKD